MSAPSPLTKDLNLRPIKMVQASLLKSSIIATIEKVLFKLSFVIVSHVAFTGHTQELERFLREHSRKLMFIGHPFFFAKQKRSIATVYEKGHIKSRAKAPVIKGPEFFLYLKDFLMTFFFFLKFKSKFNIYVGVNPLNCFVGLILKRLGFVKVVIFYVIDYVPIRFNNRILNRLYHSMDKLCVYYADYTWNLADAMAIARKKRGFKKGNQITVPTGTNFNRIKHPSGEEINPAAVAFLSHLRHGQGIELILESMKDIVKNVPSVKFLVIGTGELEDHFKKEVKKKSLNNNIVFLGYIEDHNSIEEIISKCRVGVAPYFPDPNSFTWYADPGKPKVYLGCGVPVIITRVPEVAFEIEEKGAGIVINYDKDDFTNAMLTLLTDDDVYLQYRQRAMDFASEYTWDNIFLRAFAQTLQLKSLDSTARQAFL